MRITIEQGAEVYLSGYKNFSVKRSGVLTCPWPKLGARFEVESDLRPLFPLINGEREEARYYDAPERIRFLFKDIVCTLYDHEIIAAAFSEYDEALAFSKKLITYLNDLHSRRESVTPDFKKIAPLSALDIYKLLPQNNCGECGLPSCLAFAGAVSTGRASSDQCPGFSRPIAEKAIYPVFDRHGNLTSTIELDIPEAQAAPPTPTEGPDVAALLTERELQVLKLLATGATNPQISEQLSISPHTVKTHVTHIYDKLGVSDRAQAAVWASKKKLI